ncbi:MAG: alpha-1,2-fucosyltransferase [Roseburia sp.]|nr:alpha-1,2-fucosyltransferase [Roseburia sp.]
MIVVRIYEGLGNQMFEYAYAYALNERAKRKGIKVCVDLRDEAVTAYDKVRYARPLDIKQFAISLPVAPPDVLRHWDYLSEKTPVQRVISCLSEQGLWKYGCHMEYQYQHRYHYNYSRDHFRLRDHTYVAGLYQNEEYFAAYRAALRKEFSLKEPWKLPETLEQIMKENDVISLHIRRGDYITDPKIRKVMYQCDKKYYEKALEYIRERLNRPYLFVFTNDVNWVKRNLSYDIPMAVVSDQYELTDVQELLLMSYCNHNIISNSTYSWWGAWLNTHKDKIVVAPRKWFLDRQRNTIAAKSWVKL